MRKTRSLKHYDGYENPIGFFEWVAFIFMLVVLAGISYGVVSAIRYIAFHDHKSMEEAYGHRP